ncbi:hypothetical protein C7S20_10880 [Christiangramia fulva]|uniref:Uncharacterized protein n=1 Tax=Christiangramia fulva TaxID=2126553 RepID=A0A2R3Z613_9FLAO|nr:DUF4097 family beta strand repeat-containing protein [Christiangramia fulva]AVR45716.1 hypothetical protein C7S20_10880 [Christiangramia fulva]
MKIIKLNLALVFLLFITAGGYAQTKKLSKTYNTSPDVSVSIDSRHTNVIIENWDKSQVQIEATLEGKNASKEEIQKMLDAWELKTSGSDSSVKIESGGGLYGSMNMPLPDMDMSGLKEPLSQLPGILEPLMNNLGPLLANISENPLPPEFAEKMKDMKFDYEAYKKDGDKYLEKWEANFEKKFGKDFEKKMEKWAEKMEKDSEKFDKEYEKKMEAWGEKFGKDMEAWGEEFGKQMESWGEEFGRQMEAQYGNSESNVIIINGDEVKSKRTIRIKVPKDAKLDLNVRHGELKLSSNVKNLKADISHSRLSANRISGKNTNIKVAYSPVKIGVWEYGVLSTQFVKNCSIDKVVSIKLDSNSSDILINELQKTGVLSGSFGKLDINNLGAGFETLNISLENSDLELSVPDTAFSFSYNGTQSSIKYPKSMELKSKKSYDNEMLNGFNKSRDGNANITIKANFSDVLLN